MKQQKQQPMWYDIIIAGESLNEKFTELTIKTLKQQYIENAYDIVWTRYKDKNCEIKEIDVEVEKLIRENKAPQISEHIAFTRFHQIEICLNKQQITDEIYQEAITILANNIQLLKTKTFIRLSEPFSFTFDEIAHLFRQ